MIYLGNQQVGLNNSQNDEFVSYIENQELTNVQKERARNNIGAANEADLASKVSDVQVNGTSILDTEGVANVPIADGTNYGVLKAPDGYITGLQLDSSGYLKIAGASVSHVKNGTSTVRPIIPSIQDQSTFYGLAKAAGSDEKDSTLPMGQYSEAAKVAIQKMLGLYQRGELIRDYITTEDQTSVSVSTDEANQSFELIKAKIIVMLPAMTTGEASSFLADALTINELNGNADTYRFPTMQAPAAGRYFFYEIETYGGFLTYSRGYNASSYNSSSSSMVSYVSNKSPKCVTGFRILQYSTTTSLVPAGTRILIFGIRA